MSLRVALVSSAAAGLVSVLAVAGPASANCGDNGKPVGEGCEDRGPRVSATPELDSLALLGTGVVGLAGYATMRLRAGRRRSQDDE
ncbi:MAG: hypothetical protein JOZ81_26715 [Chloroflexi bacterium]|nr:hypothetical protein [Chloroflexota bacterium]MBV9544381.1 hypothetical protein [Chloroflexota bacterium]